MKLATELLEGRLSAYCSESTILEGCLSNILRNNGAVSLVQFIVIGGCGASEKGFH